MAVINGADFTEYIFGSTENDTINAGGGFDVVNGDLGDDEIHGSVDDDILFGAEGNDSIFGEEHLDSLDGGSGNDTLDGGAAIDTLSGGVGNDSLLGGAGADELYGDEGNDTLDGGSDQDVFDGGEGSDTFYGTEGVPDEDFIGGIDADGDDIDTVTYDVVNTDSIFVDVLAGGNAEVHQVDIPSFDELFGIERIIASDQNNDWINFTAYAGGGINLNLQTGVVEDGGDISSVLQFEVAFGTNFGDQLTGSSIGNALYGQGGNDTLNAGAGNDQVFGGNGNDSVNAGDGHDVVDIGVGSDILNGSTGYDELITLNSVIPIYYDVAAGLIFHGSEQDDVRGFEEVHATESITDDVIDFSGYGNAINYNMSSRIITGVTGKNALNQLYYFDQVIGTSKNDVISGSVAEETLDGGAGNDVLNGGSGNDLVYGGNGQDAINDSAGSDTYYGGIDGSTDSLNFNSTTAITLNTHWSEIIRATSTDVDIFSDVEIVNANASANNTLDLSEESVDGDGVTLNLSTGAISSSDSGLSFARNFRNVILSEFSDTIIGSKLGNTYTFLDDENTTDLNDDSITDTAGGVDTLDVSQSSDDWTIDTALGTASKSAGDTITLVVVSPTVRTTIEVIRSGSGNDAIATTTLAETVFGGEGDDSILTGDGNDTVREVSNDGSDTLNGGNGTDTVSFDDNLALSPITFNTNTGVITQGSDINTMSGFEKIVATDSNSDVIDASGDINGFTLNLSTGAAISLGSSGIINALQFEHVIGSHGVDKITGGGKNETLIGNAGNDSINAAGGDDSLEGGIGRDTLNGGVGDDTYSFDNTWGKDTVIDTAGSDTFDLSSVTQDLTINLLATSNQVSDGTNLVTFNATTIIENFTTGSGNDQIFARSTISETFDGGSETTVDVLTYNTTARLAVDAVNNFVIINGIQDDFTNFETLEAGTNTADSIIFTTNTDAVVVDLNIGLIGEDVNGNGILDLGEDLNGSLALDGFADGGLINIANFELVVGSAFDDYVIAAATGTSIEGGLGSDSLFGGIGNDTLRGGFDADTLEDGDGNDQLEGADGSDTFTLSGSGNDTIDGGTSFADNDILSYNTGGGATTLTLAGTVTRGAEVDRFTRIETFEFDDAAGDTVSAAGNSRGVTIDLTTGAITNADSGLDFITGYGGSLSVLGSQFGDTLIGQAGAVNNTLNGAAGNDALTGDDGADSLLGGTGNDTIVAGDGIDELIGGSGNDDLQGDDGNDLLEGGLNNDTLQGGLGDDNLRGQEGNDTYLYLSNTFEADTITSDASGTDTVDFTLLTDNLTIDLATGSVLNTTSTTDSLSWAVLSISIENASGGDGADIITGSTAANVLSGNAGIDTISAGDDNDTVSGGDDGDTLNGENGNDVITGDANDDSLLGGAGDDILTGGTGDDTVDGDADNDTYVFDDGHGADQILIDGAGTDTLDFSLADLDYTIDLSAGTTTNGTDTLAWNSGVIDIENAIGGSGADGIIGLASGGSLSGGSGNDTLTGGIGDDTLNGGFGDDSLVGGLGDDTYIYTDHEEIDVIDDAGSTVTDTLDLSNYLLASVVDWIALDTNTDTNLDALVLDFGNESTLTIQNYFDNSATTVLTSLAGAGYIEIIAFSDDSVVDFAQVQLLV
jgi:Ca2+-binding RTX toxin-like protein